MHSASISLTPSARTAARLASGEAEALGHEYIGTEAFLVAIAKAGGAAAALLAARGADAASIARLVRRLYLGKEQKLACAPGRSLLQSAIEEARLLGQAVVDSEHLLLAILKDETCRASAVLATLGMHAGDLRTEILSRADSEARNGDYLG